MFRSIRLGIVAGLLISSTGCLIDRLAQPAEFDNEDAMDALNEDWDNVGKIGRTGRRIEKDPDPWFKQNWMSDEARSIEHNVGVD
ncbi:MAG: hypothetical protein R3C20_24665 [Planctomycetaceae bacterium]